ncbi:MAG: DNA translocase FtsK 4TM domain-containing protein [Pseudomonadota bacterium]
MLQQFWLNLRDHDKDSPQAGHWRETAMILWVALGILLLGALITYPNSLESAAQRSSFSDHFAGRFGHSIVQDLLGYLGYAVLLLPLLSFLMGWRAIQKPDPDAPMNTSALARFVGSVGILTSLCILLDLLIQPPQFFAWSGGSLGHSFAVNLENNLSVTGTYVLTLAIMAVSLTWAIGFSWMHCFERLGYVCELGLRRFNRLKQASSQFKINLKRLPKPIPSELWIPPQLGGDFKEKEQEKDKEKTPRTYTARHQESAEKTEARRSPEVIAKKAVKPKSKSVKFTGGGPSLDLLDMPEAKQSRGFSKADLDSMSSILEEKLNDFGIQATVETVLPGPVVTRFEIQPAAGIKVSRITNLAKDLARSMAVISVRVVEVIPGKTTVGIEIPNQHREIIRLREIVDSREHEEGSPLTLALGKDISGQPIVADLSRMPHLLVAGTTGSGKSVGLNAMIVSLLFKATPEEVRLIMIDPKMLELSVYDDIPHLLTPVVTDMKEAANALRWCVVEMDRRYQLMSALGVRNLIGYNKKVTDAAAEGKPIKDPLATSKVRDPSQLGLMDMDDIPDLKALPYVVVIIDEFADMMMIVGKKVEELIARIAQKARAAGIHLILATQRPSVDVITGLIKANIPTRIAFQVSSKIDSRTIIDQGGAEQLLGHGDMLYLPPGTGLPMRVHGAFVADEEVHRVCDDWRARGEPDYLAEILEGSHASLGEGGGEEDAAPTEYDPLYDQAVAYVTQSRKASISSVQRKLKIGYNRAARIVETMEQDGVVTEMQHNGSREVLAPPPMQ